MLCYFGTSFPASLSPPQWGRRPSQQHQGNPLLRDLALCMSWVHRKGTVSAATQTTRAGISVPARIVVGLSHLSLCECWEQSNVAWMWIWPVCCEVRFVVVRHWGPVQNCSGETSCLNCVICKADRWWHWQWHGCVRDVDVTDLSKIGDGLWH